MRIPPRGDRVRSRLCRAPSKYRPDHNVRNFACRTTDTARRAEIDGQQQHNRRDYFNPV